MAACSHQEIQQQFIPLDIGQIKPEGWLRDWAEDAANGITGHLDEYEPVFEYGWLGRDISARQSDGDGKVSSTGWLLEQCAYWLDGAVKLGYMLQDSALIAKTTSRLDGVVDGVLASENHTFIHWKPDSIVVAENGNFKKGGFNNWAHGLMGRCLVSYYQATHDERILKALEKVYSSGYYLKSPEDDIYGENAGLTQGLVRGATNLDAMSETYMLTGNKAILKAMKNYAAQPNQIYEEQRLLSKKERWDTKWVDTDIHGVSFNEIARVPALLSLWTGNKKELEATVHLIEWGDKYNLLPYGVISAEEYISGIGPYRFTETCDIPAAMWTKTWLLRITGESSWADQIERAFLNAGPVPVSRDFKTMSYYQSPNRINEDTPPAPPVPGGGSRIVYTPTGNKTLCCVGSSNWIIPNYVQNMWMRTKDGGLAFLLYGPCSVQADGISLNCATDFPFGEGISISVSAGKPVRKALSFRIPDWVKGSPVKPGMTGEGPGMTGEGPGMTGEGPSWPATTGHPKPGMTVSVNGEPVKAEEKDGFMRVCRKWEDGDVISINLPMEPAISEWEDNCYPQTDYFLKPHWGRINEAALDTLAGRKYDCITYGPLLYALPLYDLDENTVVPGQKSDFVLKVEDASQIEVERRAEMPERWGWRIEDAPVVLRVPAGIPGQAGDDGAVMPDTIGHPDTITLVPYNCTKFRVSMFKKP